MQAKQKTQSFDNLSPETDADVYVSNAFYPGAYGLDADLVFRSSDSVLFYVHSHVLSAASEHAFRPILPGPISDRQHDTPIVHVPETSDVLNIIIHALYSVPYSQYSPSFTALVTAVDRMLYYEIDPKQHIVPSNPLHAQLLSYAPFNQLELYALAARHDIYDVAAHASSHLLSYPLFTISDEMATRMGAVYLKRLLSLHADRLCALKNIILVPPLPHLSISSCGADGRLLLVGAWATATSRLAWDAQPGISVPLIMSVFTPLQDELTCPLCRQNFSDRVAGVAAQWSSVKVGFF
ncbi:hypothetical protein BDZ94DRAFT_1167148 [Collybia nuda]|uniref:BTB domain-containing protein n=1 Tax=Collybia nuda TaxID=64659 RepID=A0A9P5Y527_9AGAR|nr:hypothetical protein BDZ94DRAFT_1167148 [Collybia nuda]